MKRKIILISILLAAILSQGQVIFHRNDPVVDVRLYNILPANSAATNDTNWAALMAAVTAGSTIYFPVGHYNFALDIAVSKACTIRGDGWASEIHQTVDSKRAFLVTSSSVIIRDLKLTGTGSAYANTSDAIWIIGTDNQPAAPTYITDICVRNVYIYNWKMYGISSRFVKYFSFTDNKIDTVAYGGIDCESCSYGNIANNRIYNITGNGTAGSNAYGITVSRLTASAGELTAYPRSAEITIVGNTINSVATWTGIDGHGPQRITVSANTVYGCDKGIDFGSAKDNSGNNDYAPLDITIAANVVESGKTDGTEYLGISLQGASTTAELATGSITGNTIIGFGHHDDDDSGNIKITYTKNIAIAGNDIRWAAQSGIAIGGYNYGFNFSGNTITDVWADADDSVGIRILGTYNTGIVSNNSISQVDATKTYRLDTAGGMTFRIDDAVTNIIEVGDNRTEATLLQYGPWFEVGLKFTPLKNVDHTYSGDTCILTAHENLAFGDICYLNASGKAALGDADAIGTSTCLFMAVGTITANTTGRFLMRGFIRDDTWNWSPCDRVYLSLTGTTGNTLTQTAPTASGDVIQILGLATNADRIYFNPQLPYAAIL